MIEVKYIVAWSSSSGMGWGREYRTFSTAADAERFYDALNLRPDCFEGFVARIEDEI